MKKRINASVILYVCGALWMAAAAIDFMTKNNSMAITYLCLGSLWMILGSIYMARDKKESLTVGYYDQHAKEYAEGTENADVSELRNEFLKHIPDGGLILDWGCGSGRDSKAFIDLGYNVEAIDASKELCAIASERTGIDVRCETFDQLDAKNKYDGIWACASLLHLDKEHIEEVLNQAVAALKVEGVLYMSYKLGDFEGERDGRYFTDMTEESMSVLLKPFKKLKMVNMWTSTDVRDDREEQKWLNVIEKKL